METLTGLVRQVLETNQELCLRIGNLELLSSNQTIRSVASLNENDREDDAVTIRPKRFASDPRSEASDKGLIDAMSFTFEQDLRQSRVYNRVWRRKSLASLSSSAAPSFGWSCLSEMSLANVSNISVISLPIAADELSNGGHYPEPSISNVSNISAISLPIAANELSKGEHYRGPSIPQQTPSSNLRRAGNPQVTPSLYYRMSAIGQSSHRVEARIAILGEESFLCV